MNCNWHLSAGHRQNFRTAPRRPSPFMAPKWRSFRHQLCCTACWASPIAVNRIRTVSVAHWSSEVKHRSNLCPVCLSKRPARSDSYLPCGLSALSLQPMKRPSRFQMLCSCRIKTSCVIRYASWLEKLLGENFPSVQCGCSSLYNLNHALMTSGICFKSSTRCDHKPSNHAF